MKCSESSVPRTTSHDIVVGAAQDLGRIPRESIDLVVTSPPYPMIAMWDAAFAAADPEVGFALDRHDGILAFELMHRQLDLVWARLVEVTRPGAIICINIGDATRRLGSGFRLYANHARIIQSMNALGFESLPDILWRKPTNAPNKFLGSGMLPAGAYVTYEHEYILIFRKGGGRAFASVAEKALRRRSAFFWEERNAWFSDLWSDLRGTTQLLDDRAARERSAAYPFELAYRLVQMYSLIGDTVLDPFLGTGTTSAAALASGRNSVGVEIDAGLLPTVRASLEAALPAGRARARTRLCDHESFVTTRLAAGKAAKHVNEVYGFPVVTGQETEIELVVPRSIEVASATLLVASVEPFRWEHTDDLFGAPSD